MDKIAITVALLVLSSGFTITGYAQEVNLPISLEHYQAPMLLQLSDRTHLLGFADIEHKDEEGGRPPLSGKRIAGETVCGVLSGYVGMGVGGAIVYFTVPITKPGTSRGYAPESSLVIGSGTSILAVYGIGSVGDETGSFLVTLACGVAGSIIGFRILASVTDIEPFADDLDEANSQMGPKIRACAIGATIGAIIGFNLTRRYNSTPASEAALINVRNGRMNFAVPSVYFRGDSFGRGGLSQNVDLLRVRF